MSFTNRSHDQDDSFGRHAIAEGVAPGTITAIPLSELQAGNGSIGSLVKDATTQVSTLVRAEVALAKAEVTGEIKKGVQGSIFFILALTVLLFSAFFFFFFTAELLDLWVARWLAFLIVFLAMVLFAALLGLLGFLKVRKVRAPAKTIDSLKQAKTVLPTGADQSGLAGKHAGSAVSG